MNKQRAKIFVSKGRKNLSFVLFWLLNNVLVDEKCSTYICRDVKMINTAFENSRYCLDRKSVCCSLFLTCQTGPACFVNIRSSVAVKIVLWDARKSWQKCSKKVTSGLVFQYIFVFSGYWNHIMWSMQWS